MNHTKKYFENEEIYKRITELISDLKAISKSENFSELNNLYDKTCQIDDYISKESNTIFLKYLNTFNKNSANSIQTIEDIILIAELSVDICLEILRILKLMKQLAIKSATETVNDFQREMISDEYVDLIKNMDKIIYKLNNPCNNGKPLFNTKDGILNLKYLCGCDLNEVTLILEYSFLSTNIFKTDIVTQCNAQKAIDLCQTKINECHKNLAFNKNTIVQLRVIKKNKDNTLKTKICYLIECLQKRAEYYKCKGKINYSASTKNDLPNWLN